MTKSDSRLQDETQAVVLTNDLEIINTFLEEIGLKQFF
jgi:hypothetical protein